MVELVLQTYTIVSSFIWVLENRTQVFILMWISLLKHILSLLLDCFLLLLLLLAKSFYSFLAFEVLFDEILGLRLFAIVLNQLHYCKQQLLSVVPCPSSNLQRLTHSPSFFVASALIRLIGAQHKVPPPT